MPKHYASSCLVALLLALAAPLSFAANYYVSPDGDDAAPGTSVSEPWGTIAKANGAVQPGDVVYLRGGTYLDDPISPGQSGTATATIRYVAHQGETPVLTSDKVRGLDIAIELSGRSYISVEGIHVDGVKRNPDARVNHFVSIMDGSHNVVRDCVFEYAHGWIGIQLDDNAHHNKLLDNTIDTVGIYDNGKGQDWGNSIQIDNAHYNLVQGNTIKRGAHNLLEVHGNYNVFRDNVFDNDWGSVLGAGKGGRNVELVGEYNVFERNVLKLAGKSTDKPGNAGTKTEGVGNIVRGNYIFGNSNEGITSQSRASQKVASSNYIFHNTIYGNGGPAWGLIFYNGGKEISRNVFKNNIVHGNAADSGADFVFQLASNPSGVVGASIIANNLIGKASSGEAAVDIAGGGGKQTFSQAESSYAENFLNNIQASPTFASADPVTREDFALAPGSRGIDEAAPLTHTADSGFGKVILVQDAGYFFDGSTIVSGDRIQIDGGTVLQVADVDYSANSITLAEETQWQADAAVTLEFHGAAPDIGAYELGLPMGGTGRPTSPGSLGVRVLQ